MKTISPGGYIFIPPIRIPAHSSADIQIENKDNSTIAIVQVVGPLGTVISTRIYDLVTRDTFKQREGFPDAKIS